MRTLAGALLGFLVLAGAACQSPTAPPPARVELGAAGRAAAALEAGRYAEAVGLTPAVSRPALTPGTEPLEEGSRRRVTVEVEKK